MATITGGRTVAGEWAPLPNKPHIFHTFVGRGADGVRFRQLYVNGERAVRARTPLLPDGGTSTWQDMLDCRRAPTDWRDSSGAYDYRLKSFRLAHRPPTENAELSRIEMVSLEHWNSYRCPLTAISPDRAQFNLDPTCLALSSVRRGFELNRPTWFENAFDFIDEPGEWYHDRQSGHLYYYPSSPAEIESAEFQVPGPETLIRIEGTRGEPVSFVAVEGLRFEHTTWDRPTQEGYPSVAGGVFLESCPDCPGGRRGAVIPGALRIQYARHVRVERNRFHDLGGTAVQASLGSKHLSVRNNLITEIGGGGIQLGEPFRPRNEADYVEDVEIIDNVVRRIGLDHHDTVGIGSLFARRIHIEHNTVQNTPYTGIFVGWGNSFDVHPSLEANRIVGNRVENVMQVLMDGGGIYTTSPQRDTVIEGNFVSSLHLGLRQGNDFAVRTCRTVPSIPIYLDKGSSGITVDNNVFDRVAQLGVHNIDVVFGPRVPQSTPCSFKACAIEERDNRLSSAGRAADEQVITESGARIE